MLVQLWAIYELPLTVAQEECLDRFFSARGVPTRTDAWLAVLEEPVTVFGLHGLAAFRRYLDVVSASDPDYGDHF